MSFVQCPVEKANAIIGPLVTETIENYPEHLGTLVPCMPWHKYGR